MNFTSRKFFVQLDLSLSLRLQCGGTSICIHVAEVTDRLPCLFFRLRAQEFIWGQPEATCTAR